MQEGLQPISSGFFFSLGHSTIVVLASVAVAATAVALLLDGHGALLRELTTSKPGITLAEIKVALAELGIEAELLGDHHHHHHHHGRTPTPVHVSPGQAESG